MLHGKLQANFHRRRTIIRKKQMSDLARNPFAQPRDKLLRGIMGEPRKNDLLELTALLGNRGRDPRIRVPVQIHPPRRDGINDLPSVGCIQKRAFRFCDVQRRRIQNRVGERMPDLQRRTHCAKAERSKWFRKTCMSAVRCRFGNLGISPITRTCPNFSMVSRFSRF